TVRINLQQVAKLQAEGLARREAAAKLLSPPVQLIPAERGAGKPLLVSPVPRPTGAGPTVGRGSKGPGKTPAPPPGGMALEARQPLPKTPLPPSAISLPR